MIDAELRNILMRIGHDINTIANDVRARHLAELRKKAVEHEYWQEREAARAKRDQAAKAEADWHAFIQRLMRKGRK